jgi:hypothetical protein
LAQTAEYVQQPKFDGLGQKPLKPTTDKGFHIALKDLNTDKAFVVCAGTDRYRRAEGIEAIGLRELAAELAGTTGARPTETTDAGWGGSDLHPSH